MSEGSGATAAGEPREARTPASLQAAVAARRYYLDGKQKSEVADELGISRFRVARLLDEALAQGIVRIHVEMPTHVDVPLGDEVAKRFGLTRAIAVQTFENVPEVRSALVGAAVADLLADTLTENDTLGISWGESLTRVVDAIRDDLPAMDVVQLVGGVHAAEMNVSGVELVRRLSQKTGGRAFPLHVPLLVGSPTMALQLRADRALQDSFARLETVTVALVGIGSWSPPRSSLLQELSEEERSDLLAAGAAGDLCTHVFDEHGTALSTPGLERALGISLEQLRRVPTVIAVASGPDKVRAIASALRSGIVSTLVTDGATAEALLG